MSSTGVLGHPRDVSPTFAFLAGVGAFELVLSIVRGAVAAAFTELLPRGGSIEYLSTVRALEWSALAGTAAGVAVSYRLGGRRALGFFIVFLVAVLAYVVLSSLSTMEACRMRLGCVSAEPPLSRLDALIRQSPTLLGIALGLALIPLILRLALPPSPALEAAGTFAVARMLVFAPLGPYDLRAAPGLLTDLGLVSIGLQLLAPLVIAGGVIAARSRSLLRSAAAFGIMVMVMMIGDAGGAILTGRGGDAIGPLATLALGAAAVAVLVALAIRRPLQAVLRS